MILSFLRLYFKISARMEYSLRLFRDFTILQSVTYDLLVLSQCYLRPFHSRSVSLTTFWHSTLEPNFTYDLLSRMDISINSQPIATKVCQCMGALKCIFLMQKNDFLKIVTYNLVALMGRNICSILLKFQHVFQSIMYLYAV